ncbi:MAG: FecR domain-containing protein [Polyangiaceae bacterium]
MTSKPAPRTCSKSANLHEAFSTRRPKQVAAHLRECTLCSAEWKALEALADAARKPPAFELTAAEKAELRGRLLIGARAIAKETRPARQGRRIAAALAALGIAAAAALALGPTWSPPPTTISPLVAPHASAPPLYRATILEQGDARFSLVSPQPDETVRLDEGTLRVDVAPLQRGERFRVVTRDGEVEVHGTIFSVTVEHGRLTLVTVERGRVEVRAAAGTTRLLTPGEVWSPGHGAQLAPIPPDQAPQAPAAPAKTHELAGTATSSRSATSDPVAARTRPGRTSPLAHEAADDADAPRKLPSAAEIAFQEGWAALRSGDPVAASRSFSAVPPDSPLGQDAAFWRAISLARAGRAQQATRALENFLNAFPNSPHRDEALVTLASLLQRAGKHAAAAARYREALASPRAAIRARAQRGLDDTQ